MNRARKILNMATSIQKSEQGQPLPGHNNIVDNKTYSNARDSSDTNSIPDSQPDFDLSILEEENSEVSYVRNTKDTNRPKILVEQSDSISSSSDSDSDSDTNSSRSSTSSSSSDADFSSDDSVKDPNFLPNHERSSDSEEDIQSKVITKTFCISPQPGPSRIEPHLLVNDNLSVDLDTQSPNIDTQSSISHNQSPSVNIQSPSIGSEPASVDPKPLSRKRKANPESWKRNKTKTLINSGKAHITMSKSKRNIAAKKMGPVCSDKCKFKCQNEFSFEQRFAIFSAYWDTGDLNVQRQFIYNHMTNIEPKYRYTRVGSTRQNLNYAYHFTHNDKRIRVCKLFFMNTLAISDKSIRTVVKKTSGSITGIEMKDNRGKHGNQFKLDAALKDGAKEHINSIPRIESHYCRARSKREYIEGSRSIAALHRDYVDKCKAEGKDYLSYKLYYNVFVNDFNISFWKPKKDQCEDCIAFANVEDKTLLQVKYDLHLKEKDLARAEKENDKKNISENFVVCVYDLQAVMPCPQGEVSSFYYVSKLNVLNFTVTELGSNNTHCYVWHEGAGARGANEIGSCVLAYLKNLNEKASDYFDVVFYSDNCCGQHKNKFMLATYQYAINELSKLRSVTHKFLIKGHTQNEGDAAHSLIQRNISNALKSSPIYVPDQYITLIKTAKKKGSPFVVHELNHESFLDLKCLAVGNYTTAEDGQKVKWADIKIIKVHKDYENKFFFKTSYEDEEFTSVATLTKRRETSPPSPIGDEKESKMNQVQFSPPLEKQNSTMWQKRQQAVCVRHAFKHYGSNKRPNHVLSNLNMSVAKGTIYGLLGASGCGKTTLLSCIVGRRKLNRGEIWVLGGKPGTKGSGVPGKRVGYMPQEIALYGEFTIKETMMYFGWIFGMETKEIVDRLRFLLDFLDLPSENRMVKNLSGGQQRRVSFAVALMHDPELLILDEPTVGVDPLLRQSIWTHLVRITSSGDKTVIITTHYIEEARQAHCIGLMRSGRLLAEESPQALLTMYSCISLEDVFLKLSRRQGQANQVVELNVSGGALGLNKMSKREEAPYAAEDNQVVGLNFHQSKEVLIVDHAAGSNGDLPGKMTEAVKSECEDCGDCFNFTSRGKIKALIQKNFLRMWRNIGVMLFIFALPVMQVILFCLAIGRDPSGLHLAIVNDDVHVLDGYCPYNSSCSMKNLSCRYLANLKNQSIIKDYYADLSSAIHAVEVGNAWGAIYFNENYTDSLVARLALADTADNETISSSEVQVWLDMSNQQIGLMLNRDIQFSYRDFAKDLLSTCNYNPKVGDIPIDFKDPIYGDNNPSFTDFVAPGVILTIVFFLAVALTSSALIVERMEGLLDRSWVAGVSPGEILFSHVVTQFVVMCGQTALVLIFMILVFGVKCNGNIIYVIMLTLLQGLCGMCFGFVISAACELERNAIQLALGSFYPTLLLSGVIWPIEGMPWALRGAALGLPLTLATSALRAVLTRGWPLTEPAVYLGFVATLAWIALFLTLTLLILRFKRG